MDEKRATERTPHGPLRLACLWLCMAQALTGQTARAEEVTFDEALALGDRTPEVMGLREALEARESADQGIRGAAGPTNLTIMPGALVSPRQDDVFELQTNLTQGWSLGGLGGARREAAEQEREALGAAVRARALRARLEAARRWIDLATLMRIRETVDQRIDAAEDLVSQRQRALATGVGTVQPLAEARAVLAELRQKRLDLEGDVFAASSQLALAMGRAPEAERLQAAGDLPNPPMPSEAEIRRRIGDIDAAPDVIVEQLRETASRARMAETSALYAPVLDIGVQAERAAAGDRGAWVVYGISGLSFHGFGQERRSTALAKEELAIASASTADARLRARAEVEEALHDLEHTATVATLLEEQTLPALHGLVSSRARAVALGEELSFALTEARDRELAAMEAVHRARGANSWARVHMWLFLAELAAAEGDR
ncbi:MAG: TolC family protein [Polyangiales bacterium]